jgi:hypothetical protein
LGTRALLAALWLFHWLPLPIQAACGSAFGRLGWHLAGSRRKIALRNLELCFPELARASASGSPRSTSAGSAAASSSAACSGMRRRAPAAA